jgi:hypothetical protein
MKIGLKLSLLAMQTHGPGSEHPEHVHAPHMWVFRQARHVVCVVFRHTCCASRLELLDHAEALHAERGPLELVSICGWPSTIAKPGH